MNKPLEYWAVLLGNTIIAAQGRFWMRTVGFHI